MTSFEYFDEQNFIENQTLLDIASSFDVSKMNTFFSRLKKVQSEYKYEILSRFFKSLINNYGLLFIKSLKKLLDNESFSFVITEFVKFIDHRYLNEDNIQLILSLYDFDSIELNILLSMHIVYLEKNEIKFNDAEMLNFKEKLFVVSNIK